MLYCDLTLPSPAENLACDEALLEAAEQGRSAEVVRLWESARHFVVLGYANRAQTEVNLSFCRDRQIPVLRRCSGGGTVLQGPGCLNYTLILKIFPEGPLAGISTTNNFVMERQRSAMASLLNSPVQRQGCTDLTLGGLKFSGNAQRRRKNFLLFHGAFLLNMDLRLLESALQQPSREPDYRSGRSHRDFLLNLDVPADRVKTALLNAWDATTPLREIPRAEINSLVADKYSRDDWNLKF